MKQHHSRLLTTIILQFVLRKNFFNQQIKVDNTSKFLLTFYLTKIYKIKTLNQPKQ